MQTKAIAIIVLVLIVLGAGFYLTRYGNTGQETIPLEKPVTIGFVKYIPPLEPHYVGFKARMQELGHQEGVDIIYKEDIANGSIDKLHEISKRFIAEGVDILYTYPVESSVAAYEEASAAGRMDLPIVMGGSNRPEKFGLIADYRSSGNNVTGIAIDLTNLTAKKLEFLRQVAPNAKKLGIILDKKQNLAAQLVLDELNTHAAGLGFEVVTYTFEAEAPGPAATAALQTLAGSIKQGDVDALFQVPGTIITLPQNVAIVAALSQRIKAPFVGLSETTGTGSVFVYNFDILGIGRQGANIVDKIIKGVKPADIPIEYPDRNLLTVNKAVAERLGITLPETLLNIADKVISQ